MSEVNMHKKNIPLIASVGVGLVVLLVMGQQVWAQKQLIFDLKQQVAKTRKLAKTNKAPHSALAGSSLEMTRRFRALESQVAALRRGQDALRDAKQDDHALLPPRSVQPQTPLPATVSAQHVAMLGVLESEDPVVQKRVRGVLRREMDAIRKERREERRGRRDERASKLFEKFSSTAGLSQDQVQAIEPALLEEREKARDLFREARQEGDFSLVREKMERLRQETDKQVKSLLDEDQVKEYNTMREQETARFTGRRRGGRGGR